VAGERPDQNAKCVVAGGRHLIVGPDGRGRPGDLSDAGLGIVALPGYVCRKELRSGALHRVLPTCLTGDSALLPYRQGFLPSVRAFIEHLAVQLPKAVAM
jgi:hypothetical protein